MKVIVFVKATKNSEAGEMPTVELLEAMGKYNEELFKAGVMEAGEGLHPSSAGKRIVFDGANRTVVDGPFSATNELVAGYWVWNVKDMDDAVAWAKKCPNPMPGKSELEIRRIFTAEDFGDVMTPDMKAQEDLMRAQLAK